MLFLFLERDDRAVYFSCLGIRFGLVVLLSSLIPSQQTTIFRKRSNGHLCLFISAAVFLLLFYGALSFYGREKHGIGSAFKK